MKINEPGFMPQEEHLLVPIQPESVLIGIPKEQSEFENRVALTPDGVYLLVERGHSVLVEQGAGISSGYTDLEYSEVGGIISSNRDEIFGCQLVVKVAKPCTEEIKLIKPGQILLSALDINSLDQEYINSLRKKGVTAFNYSKIID
jgi:alanine dehydrogenase